MRCFIVCCESRIHRKEESFETFHFLCCDALSYACVGVENSHTFSAQFSSQQNIAGCCGKTWTTFQWKLIFWWAMWLDEKLLRSFSWESRWKSSENGEKENFPSIVGDVLRCVRVPEKVEKIGLIIFYACWWCFQQNIGQHTALLLLSSAGCVVGSENRKVKRENFMIPSSSVVIFHQLAAFEIYDDG